MKRLGTPHPNPLQCMHILGENIPRLSHVARLPRLEEHSADGIKTPFTDSNEVHSAVIGIGKAFVGTEAHRRLLKYKAITVSNAETRREVCPDCRVENRTKDYDGNKQ